MQHTIDVTGVELPVVQHRYDIWHPKTRPFFWSAAQHFSQSLAEVDPQQVAAQSKKAYNDFRRKYVIGSIHVRVAAKNTSNITIHLPEGEFFGLIRGSFEATVLEEIIFRPEVPEQLKGEFFVKYESVARKRQEYTAVCGITSNQSKKIPIASISVAQRLTERPYYVEQGVAFLGKNGKVKRFPGEFLTAAARHAMFVPSLRWAKNASTRALYEQWLASQVGEHPMANWFSNYGLVDNFLRQMVKV